MHEQQTWTPADDEVVRGALNTLRLDAEALPLADVRFVKARGVARRRRYQVVGVASAAAAVAALSFVGFNTVGSNQGLDLRPAAPSATAPSSTSSTGPLASPGPLLAAAEWQRGLGITKTVDVGDMGLDQVMPTCLRPPGTLVAMGYANIESPGFSTEVQATYRAASPNAGNAAAAFAVNQLVGCQKPVSSGQPAGHWKLEADAGWPKVLSSATADGKDWFIVAHEGALTSVLLLNYSLMDGSSVGIHHFSLAEVQGLALVAQQHLVQEVERGAPR